MQEIACSTGDFAVNDTLHVAQVVVNAHVDNAQVKAMLATKHVHATASMREIDHLLPCHLAWRHTHALALNAMVTAEQQVARMVQAGRQGMLNQAHLHGQFF